MGERIPYYSMRKNLLNDHIKTCLLLRNRGTQRAYPPYCPAVALVRFASRADHTR